MRTLLLTPWMAPHKIISWERAVVLTPDPLLGARWGGSSWGHTLRADCVDAGRFRQFYLDHFGQGPEAVCSNGNDFGGTPPCQ